MSKNFISLTFSTPPHTTGVPMISNEISRDHQALFWKKMVFGDARIRWCAYLQLPSMVIVVPPSLLREIVLLVLDLGGWWQTIDLDFLRCIRAGPSGVVCSSIMRRYSLAPWRQCCLEFGGFLHRFVLWDWCQKKLPKRLPCAVHIDIFFDMMVCFYVNIW